MDDPKQVLVGGFYGSANIGDEILLATVLGWLRELGVSATVISLNPAYTEEVHGVRAVDFHNLGEIVAALIRSDLFILGGGGIFQDHHPFSLPALYDPLIPDIAQYARPVYAARQLGKETLVLAHGVGPLRSEQSRAVVRDIFANVHSASLRDAASSQLLSQIGVARTFPVAADPAWAAAVNFPVDSATASGGVSDRPLCLGLIVREWPNHSDWQGKLIDALNQVLDSRWCCRWISFQTAIDATKATSDRPLLEMLARGLKAEIAGEFVDCRSIDSAIEAIAKCDAVLSMRLHGSILTIKAGKSCGFLEYDDKMVFAHDAAGVPANLRLALTAPKEVFAARISQVLKERESGWRIAPMRLVELEQSALTHRAILSQVIANTSKKPALHWDGRDFDWMACWLDRAIWQIRMLERDRNRAQEHFEYGSSQLLEAEKTSRQLDEKVRALQLENEKLHALGLKENEKIHALRRQADKFVLSEEKLQAQKAYIAEQEASVAQLQRAVEQLQLARDQLQRELKKRRGIRGLVEILALGPIRRLARLPKKAFRRIETKRSGSARRSAATFGAVKTAPNAAMRHLRWAKAFDDIAILREQEVVIFSSAHFEHLRGHHPSAWLARTAQSAGHRVYFVSPDPIETYSLGIARLFLGTLSPEDLFAGLSAKAVLICDSLDPAIVPFFAAGHQRGLRTVLDLRSLPTSATTDEPLVARLVECSSQVVADRARGSQLQGLHPGRVSILGASVCHKYFDTYQKYARPADLPAGTDNVIVYAPGGDVDIDWSYLARSAKINSSYRFLVIGTTAPAPLLPKNVLRLGDNALAEANRYIAHCDLVLVPAAEGAGLCQPVFQGLYAGGFLGRPVVCNRDPEIDTLGTLRIQPEPVSFGSETDLGSEGLNDLFVSEHSALARLEVLVPPRGNANVSVVILIHNNAKIIGRCLRTLLAHCGPFLHEIIVVDNVSTDGGGDIVSREFPEVTLLRNTQNGCSSGRNLGSRHATGEYIAYFDSDQWFTGGAGVVEALTILERHADIGTIGWNAGWFDANRDDLGGLISDNCPNRAMNASAIKLGYRTDIGFLGTSGMFLRRALFEATSGFDTFYDPTIFEDTDICFQIRALSLKNAFRDLSGIRHQPHQTTGADGGSDAYRELFRRNSAYFKNKWSAYPEFFLDYT